MNGIFIKASLAAAMTLCASMPVLSDDLDVVNQRQQADADLQMRFSNAQQIGEVTRITGQATIERPNGTKSDVLLGHEVYLGDVVETGSGASVSIGFVDGTSHEVAGNSSVGIDEFVFDPSGDATEPDHSLLRSFFSYTSKIIGRSNSDSVQDDAPVGSLGIRG